MVDRVMSSLDFAFMVASADDVIEAMLRICPGHQAGTRPIHARGIAATGFFQASEVAATYTTAAHFAGGKVPAVVRFSNADGRVTVPDADPLVRGMAVKFYLGATPGDPVETDMLGMTLPTFFVGSLGEFMDMMAAVVPGPVRPRTRWESLLGLLRLQSTKGPVRPGERELFDFTARHQSARVASMCLGLQQAPVSYARCCFHVVHTFQLVNGAVRTAVRFQWDPVAGVRPAVKGTVGNYLQDELAERIARGPVEFVLRMQIAEPGDDTSDPTIVWPMARKWVVMGTLRLDALAPDQDFGCERLRFNPTRLVPGIEISDDAILQARQAVYERSAERRLAVLEDLQPDSPA